MSRDKRQYERYAARWRISFSSPEISCESRTADISQNGASFHSDVAIPNSVRATVTIFLPPSAQHPRGRDISMHARVVYCILQGKSGFRIGLEFTKIEEKTLEILSRKLMQLQAMNNEFK